MICLAGSTEALTHRQSIFTAHIRDLSEHSRILDRFANPLNVRVSKALTLQGQLQLTDVICVRPVGPLGAGDCLSNTT